MKNYTEFKQFKERVLKDPKVKKHYVKIEAFKMKTYCFTVKNGYDHLLSFSLESEFSLSEVVKSKQFIERLESGDFFDDDENFSSLDSSEWSCFSVQEGVKGVFTEETFDIKFSVEKIWCVS